MPVRPAFFCRVCATVLAALLFTSLLAGCTSPSSLNQAVSATHPDILISLNSDADGFAETAKRVLAAELQGHALAFDTDAKETFPLRIDLSLSYRNLTETEFETIWRATTLVLLTLYPSTCQHRAYSLTAKISDAQGHSRAYEKIENTVSWLWLMNGQNCGETPTHEEVASVTERLVKALTVRMKEEETLSGSALAVANTRAPSVFLLLNRGTEIAEKVLAIDQPFERWTMNQEAGESTDYRIDLLFDIYPGGFSILRGYLGILTLGLTSPCKGSTVTLSATVTGPNAAPARSYMFKKTLTGRLRPGFTVCELADEITRPEIFAELLRELFGQISKEGLIGTQTPLASPLPPLVRISATQAEGIVRRETLHAAPFQRYYFLEAKEYLPDYTLALDIRFAGGERKDLSTAKSAGAGLAIAYGINVFCNPTIMSVDAVLEDRERTALRRYHTKREAAFSNNTDNAAGCRDSDITNPDAVGDLIRELYKMMADDGTLADIAGRKVTAR